MFDDLNAIKSNVHLMICLIVAVVDPNHVNAVEGELSPKKTKLMHGGWR